MWLQKVIIIGYFYLKKLKKLPKTALGPASTPSDTPFVNTFYLYYTGNKIYYSPLYGGVIMNITKMSLITVTLLIASQAFGMSGLTRGISRAFRPVASRTVRSFTDYSYHSDIRLRKLTQKEEDENREKAQAQIQKTREEILKGQKAQRGLEVTIWGYSYRSKQLGNLTHYKVEGDNLIAVTNVNELRAWTAGTTKELKRRIFSHIQGIEKIESPDHALSIFDARDDNRPGEHSQVIATQPVAPKITFDEETPPRRGIFKYLCGATIAAAIGYKTMGSKE